MPANLIADHRLPRLGGRFADVSWLASGGQGGVASARLEGRRVVLKAIDAQVALGARAVFGVLQKVASPHLPAALELARDDQGRNWLVTTYLEGEPLVADYAELEPVLDEALGVARALAALHDAGTHHGDVSLSNVIRTHTGGVVLTDLGTLGGEGVGTPGFLAPECLAGHGGPAADRFALGSLICARLFGETPWRRPDVLVRLDREQVRTRLRGLADQRDAHRPDTSEVSPAFAPTLRLLARLLDPQPGARPDDPHQLVLSLENLRTFVRAGSMARSLTQWSPPRRWPFVGPLREDLERSAEQLDPRTPSLTPTPRLVVVYGPKGSGRGRVVRELAARLQTRGIVATASDADTFDATSQTTEAEVEAATPTGAWLEAWLGQTQSSASEGRIDLCADEPHWPERFAGSADGSAHVDADASGLRAAVLRAGARLANYTVVIKVDAALGELLASAADVGGPATRILALRVDRLSTSQTREVVASVVQSSELDAFASAAHSLSDGWPASLVRVLRAAARIDLQRPDLARWRDALERDAPVMELHDARAILMRTWGVEAPSPIAARYVHRTGTREHRATVQVLPWAIRAARASLAEQLPELARSCGRAHDEAGRPWPLALALECGDVERVLACVHGAGPDAAGVVERELHAVLRWAEELNAAARATLPVAFVVRLAAAAIDVGEAARAVTLLEAVRGERTAAASAAEEDALVAILARARLRLGEPKAALAVLKLDQSGAREALGKRAHRQLTRGEGSNPDLRAVDTGALDRMACHLRAAVDAGDAKVAGPATEFAESWLRRHASDIAGVNSLQTRASVITIMTWLAYGYSVAGRAGEARGWLDRAVAQLDAAASPAGEPDAQRRNVDAPAFWWGLRARAYQLRGNVAALGGDDRGARHDYTAAAYAFGRAGQEGAALWLEANLAASALSYGELGQAAARSRRAVRGLLARGELQSLSGPLWNACEALSLLGAHEETVELIDACGEVLRATGGRVDTLRIGALGALARLRRACASEHAPPEAQPHFAALQDATRSLYDAGAEREAGAMAIACSTFAATRGQLDVAAQWLLTAQRRAATHGDSAVSIDLRIAALELTRRVDDAPALRFAADELASTNEASDAAAQGRWLLAFRIDRALLGALLRLDADASKDRAVEHANARAALQRRALNSLEQIMKHTPPSDRPAATEALSSEFGERGPLQSLLRDLAQSAGPAGVPATGTGRGVHDATAKHTTAEGSEADALTSTVDQAQEERAMRLLKMYRRLAREDDLERLLGQVCDAMMELTDAERGVVVVRAGDTRLELAREFAEQEAGGPNFSRSIIDKVLTTNAPLLSVDASEDDRFGESKSISHLNLRSVVAVPLRFRGEVLGAAYVDHRLRRGAFSEHDLALMEDFAELAGLAVANAHALHQARARAESLAKEQSELSSLLDMRNAEVQGLRETLRSARHQRDERSVYRGMVGASPAMQKLYRLIDRLSDSDVPVVIYGESGTGKELVARALHEAGARGDGPFVAENCGAIPETLLESVFFGHARGAFTGANTARPGLFEAADGGTIFLDEIGEMSASMQTKLLRVLQEGEVRRVGENKTRKVDVRVVAASNKDLQALVEAGGFRRDLFYRINVVRLEIPPLRDRREDVLALVAHFLERYGAPKLELSAAARRQLLRYPWPGNVRELENEVQRWVALVEDKVRPGDLAAAISGAGGLVDDPDDLRIKPRIEAMERALITRALERSSGNQTHAAELLGLSRYGLQKKLKRLQEET